VAAWVSKICIGLIRLSWVNGCGDTGWKGKLTGEKWRQNMGICGVVGVLVLFEAPMW
jgi:hypothetical protein